MCALVSDLARLRVLAWHGIVQLIVAREGGGRCMRGAAGVQLYFPREDDDDMFICQLASIFLSITAHGLTLPCLDHNGVQTRSSFFGAYKAYSYKLTENLSHPSLTTSSSSPH